MSQHWMIVNLDDNSIVWVHGEIGSRSWPPQMSGLEQDLLVEWAQFAEVGDGFDCPAVSVVRVSGRQVDLHHKALLRILASPMDNLSRPEAVTKLLHMVTETHLRR